MKNKSSESLPNGSRVPPLYLENDLGSSHYAESSVNFLHNRGFIHIISISEASSAEFCVPL